MPLSKASSFNNKLIVEAYKHTEIRAEGNKGWVQASQKNNLKGLKVLIQANLSDGTVVPAGSTAWIKEELLHSAPFAKNKLKSETLPGEFILVTMSEVEYLDPPEGGAA
jgi:hypothetical protein